MKISKDTKSKLGCMGIALILLPSIILAKYYIFSFFYKYSYHGINPIFIEYGYPSLNLFLSIVLLIFSISLVLFLINIRNFISKEKNILIEILIFLLISLSAGSIHSIVYFNDKESYIIDEKISEIQNKRIREMYVKANNLNKEKIKIAENLIAYISTNDLKITKITDYNILRLNKYIKKYTFYEKNYKFTIEIEVFANIDRLNLEYENELLRVFTSHGNEYASQEDKKLKGIFHNIINNTNNKNDYINLIGMIIKNHKLIEDKIKSDEIYMINTGYASIDLFIYDTILKSFGKDSGDYKAVSLSSRSLTILHVFLAYLFISLYGGKKILEAIKSVKNI